MSVPSTKQSAQGANQPGGSAVIYPQEQGGKSYQAGTSAVRPVRMEEAEVEASEELSDETLFARVRAGNQESLGTLIQRYEARLFSLLVRLTGGDRNLADDLFQETFLRAVRAARTFDTNKAFRPWVTAIAVNLFRDEARKRKIRGEINIGGDEKESPVGQPEASGEAPHEAAERKDEAARVNASLSRLTEKERTVILLHFYDRMTLSEVSETLAIPVGTVKSRLHSALTRLKQLLDRSP